MPRVRVHQHVNPLSPFYRQEPEPLELESIFADPSKPLLLDLGCARGRFLLKMADADPEWNYLGVEIRKPLVEEANRLTAEAGLSNLHYAFCNAMLFLDGLLKGIPPGILQAVTIQFPDPWFKKRHAKRRMVNNEMVDTIAATLHSGGFVFVQTDIEDLANEMFELFRVRNNFSERATTSNPFAVRTEREVSVETRELPVFRSIFVLD